MFSFWNKYDYLDDYKKDWEYKMREKIREILDGYGFYKHNRELAAPVKCVDEDGDSIYQTYFEEWDNEQVANLIAKELKDEYGITDEEDNDEPGICTL